MFLFCLSSVMGPKVARSEFPDLPSRLCPECRFQRRSGCFRCLETIIFWAQILDMTVLAEHVLSHNAVTVPWILELLRIRTSTLLPCCFPLTSVHLPRCHHGNPYVTLHSHAANTHFWGDGTWQGLATLGSVHWMTFSLWTLLKASYGEKILEIAASWYLQGLEASSAVW